MNRPSRQIATVLFAAVAVALGAPIAQAAGDGRHAESRLAGPWYTPHQLKALVASSNAKPVAAGAPRYTPAELKALIACGNASFAKKQAILAGRAAS